MVYMYHFFLIHSSADGHRGCFHVLATVNSAAINVRVHVSFRIMVFSGYMPRSGIAESINVGEDVEKGELLYPDGGNVNCWGHMENSMEVLQKTNNRTTV